MATFEIAAVKNSHSFYLKLWIRKYYSARILIQKQPSRCVLIKSCSEHAEVHAKQILLKSHFGMGILCIFSEHLSVGTPTEG